MNGRDIEMAREAGIFVANNVSMVIIVKDQLERFAELVRADERDAIDQLVNDDKDLSDNDAIRISKAIKARGNK